MDLLGPQVKDDALQSPTVRKGSETQRFARELVEGVLQHLPQIDECIRSVAENWDLARMAVVDRNILRLGAFELLHRRDIPPKVAINEAVDLAKRYGSADSGTFVNGILDRIMGQIEPQPPSSDNRDPGTETEDE